MNMMEVGQTHKRYAESPNDTPKARYRTVRITGATSPNAAKSSTHFQIFGLVFMIEDDTSIAP
jgi:hypothetical protein